ncbi:MAG: DUF3018 family protein [Mycobacterium sp.]|nr:DUF3018 family protein [Mycobacterium sp.]
MASTRERVRQHRAKLRKQGLRPIQIRVPDVHAPEFAAEAHRHSAVIAASEMEADDQTFVDAISWGRDTGTERLMSRGDIYTAATRSANTRKPRPTVIIQDDRFDATASVTGVPTSRQPGRGTAHPCPD